MPNTEAGPQTISAEKLCNLTGLTDRRHRQLAQRGYFPPPIQAQYQLAQTITGAFKYYRELTGKRNGTMEQEREKKLTAERKMAERALKKDEKEFLPTAEVRRYWANTILVVRQKLLALPSKLASRLPFSKGEAAVQAEIEREMDEVLVELSKPQPYGLDETHAAGNPGPVCPASAP